MKDLDNISSLTVTHERHLEGLKDSGMKQDDKQLSQLSLELGMNQGNKDSTF